MLDLTNILIIVDGKNAKKVYNYLFSIGYIYEYDFDIILKDYNKKNTPEFTDMYIKPLNNKTFNFILGKLYGKKISAEMLLRKAKLEKIL